MSTSPQYTLKSADVYKLTINTLDTLPLTMPGAIKSRDLLRVGSISRFLYLRFLSS
jgi:hypothetical protein